jgi:hypothetical protein
MLTFFMRILLRNQSTSEIVGSDDGTSDDTEAAAQD